MEEVAPRVTKDGSQQRTLINKKNIEKQVFDKSSFPKEKKSRSKLHRDVESSADSDISHFPPSPRRGEGLMKRHHSKRESRPQSNGKSSFSSSENKDCHNTKKKKKEGGTRTIENNFIKPRLS